MSEFNSTNREWSPVLPPGVKPLTVLFIPGFRSGNESQKDAIDSLKQIFPEPSTVTSLAWEGPASDSNNNGDSGNPSVEESYWISNDPADSLTTAWRGFVDSADKLTREAFSDSVQSIMKSTLFQKYWTVSLSPLSFFPRSLQSWFDKLSGLLPITLLNRWENAKRDTDKVADALAYKIANATTVEQEKLFLIGHSLGANIVLKTLALLNAKHIKINQAALLGAAIDNDDSNIERACGAVLNPINSIINPYDHALALYALCNLGHSALGSAGYSGSNNLFREYNVGINQGSPSIEHSSSYYIQQWDKLRIK